MTSLHAFTPDEEQLVHRLLALKVADMMGRKLEEGDWTEVYCVAKSIPYRGWSNLNIDVMHNEFGIEHKLLRYHLKSEIDEACGTTLMHPALTRSIRIDNVTEHPDTVMRSVFTQYADLVTQRRKKVQEQNGTGRPVDMRTGWLLWQSSLRAFLYFEEPMQVPDPASYWAEWHESGGGVRKRSKSLWVFEKGTNRKRYSITGPAAGAKIQPYFDVPPPDDPNLYTWQVIGETIDPGWVRVWVTSRTCRALEDWLGEPLSNDSFTEAMRQALALEEVPEVTEEAEGRGIVEMRLPEDLYNDMISVVGGHNDEHAVQLLVDRLLRAGY